MHGEKVQILRKIVFLIALGAMSSIAVGAMVFLTMANDEIREIIDDRSIREISIKEEEFNFLFEQIFQDLSAISITPPVQGIIRAEDGDGYDSLQNSDLRTWKNRLQLILIGVTDSRKFYSQIRYINERGEEVVRIDHSEGFSSAVEEKDLQNKKDRYYFEESINVEAGDFFISDIDLNREGSSQDIVVPYEPTLRVSTPVFDISGRNRGFIISNINFDLFESKVLGFNGINENIFVIDENGYYIGNPVDRKKEWGSPKDLDTGFSIEEDLSAKKFKELIESDRGSFRDGDFVYTFAKINYDQQKGKFFKIVKKAEASEVFALINSMVVDVVIGAVVAVLIMVIIGIILVNTYLQDLKKLIDITSSINLGDFEIKKESLKTRDFQRILETIKVLLYKFKQSNLKTKEVIQKKLEHVEEEKNTIGLQQKALINIIDDLDYEQAKAEGLARRMDLAASAASIGIWEWDIENNILTWDERMFNLYGLQKKEGDAPYEVWQKSLHPDDRARAEKELQDAVKEGGSFDTTFRIVLPNGLIRYIRANAMVINDGEGKPVKMIGVNYDITHEKEVDRAKTEFVSLASHQLRTPLSAINWYSEMLMSGDAGEMNEKQKEYLKEVYAGSKRMVELVNSLLNVSRIELGTFAVEPTEVDLLKILRSTLDEFKPQIDEKKQNISESHGDIKKLFTDPKLIRIIFQNLISNSSKYTQEGGNIEVFLDILNPGQEFGGKKMDDESIVFSVKDNGYGIPKKQQDKIFSKLFRADNVKEKDTEGTGLGLYLLREVIRRLGGHVWFESEENEGTIFYVILPTKLLSKKQEGKALIS